MHRTETSFTYFFYSKNLGKIFGDWKRFAALNDVDSETAFRQIIPHVVADCKIKSPDIMGFLVNHQAKAGDIGTSRCFYFAECAADVLTPKMALKTGTALTKISGKDMLARYAHFDGEVLTAVVNKSPDTEALLLQCAVSEEMRATHVVMLRANEAVVDRKTGEIYFPFPTTPRKKANKQASVAEPVHAPI